jgi:hypothetical protein
MPKVDLRSFSKQMSQLGKAFDTLPEFALESFKSHTPYRSGNARRNTVLRGNSVIADYPYAQRLEDNWSSQTQGNGMVAPTEEDIQKEVDRRLKGI